MEDIPSAGVIIKFGTLNLMFDGGTTNLEEADGLLAKPKPGSRVSKLLNSLESLGKSSQLVHLPDRAAYKMGEVKRLAYSEKAGESGLDLKMVMTELDFGDRIDGLIGFRGIARLEREHGLMINHCEERVSFATPSLEIPSLTRSWRNQETYRRQAVSRRQELDSQWQRWSQESKAAERSLSRATMDRTARMPPADFSELIRAFLDQGNYEPVFEFEEITGPPPHPQPVMSRRTVCAEGARREARLKEE